MFADRVKETTTTIGTGNITLAGASPQFQSINAGIGLLTLFPYAIVGQTGTEWEVGMGFLSNATTLVRERVTASSNSGSLVNFSVGTKDVFNTIPGDFATVLLSVVSKQQPHLTLWSPF